MLDKLLDTLLLKLVENNQFIQYTNVRRITLIYIGKVNIDLMPILLKKLPSDILVFVLTDPILTHLFPDLKEYMHIFKLHYEEFTKVRVMEIEKMKEKQ